MESVQLTTENLKFLKGSLQQFQGKQLTKIIIKMNKIEHFIPKGLETNIEASYPRDEQKRQYIMENLQTNKYLHIVPFINYFNDLVNNPIENNPNFSEIYEIIEEVMEYIRREMKRHNLLNDEGKMEQHSLMNDEYDVEKTKKQLIILYFNVNKIQTDSIVLINDIIDNNDYLDGLRDEGEINSEMIFDYLMTVMLRETSY